MSVLHLPPPPLSNPVPHPLRFVGKLADFVNELRRLQRLR